MASIAYQKIKNKSTVSAIMRHNDRDERLKHEHANRDIDKSRTERNVQWFDYQRSYDRFRGRIDELDKTTNTNHRKDRVEAVAITIPMPAEGMSEKDEMRVAAAYLDFLSDRYGKANICGFWYHQDEKHDYIDNSDGTLHKSRGHIHAIVVPEVEGKLNCKKFTSKKEMINANKDLDKVIREGFNMPFLTGSGAKKQKVEDLKAKGEEQQIQAEIDEIGQRISEAREIKSSMQRTLEEEQHKISGIQQDIDETKKDVEAYEDELTDLMDRLQDLEEAINEIGEACEYGDRVEEDVRLFRIKREHSMRTAGRAISDDYER